MNLNFLLAQRNRDSEGMDDGQKLHIDSLILIPTFKIYVFSYSGRADGRTDGDINLEEPIRVASPTRINLEEPVRVASPTRINLEEPVREASPTRINLEEP